MLDTGMEIRSIEGKSWGLHLMLPVTLGITAFNLSDAFSLDNVATIGIVPTAEFLIPMNEYWTLQPYLGAGAGWQTGSAELEGGTNLIGLYTAGLRTTRWEGIWKRYWFGVIGDVNYTGVLGGEGGVLGDWGSVSIASELRRNFGAPREGARFQGGVYGQAYYYWDPVELNISGVSPELVTNTFELGVSLGSTSPYKVLGITIPRMFLGFFTGDGVDGVRIRFGRL